MSTSLLSKTVLMMKGATSFLVWVLWFVLSLAIWFTLFRRSGLFSQPCNASSGASVPPRSSTATDRVHKSDSDSQTNWNADIDCTTKWTSNIQDKYTILTPFKGHIDYAAFFAHYAATDRLHKLIVVWANDDKPPDWTAFPKVTDVTIICTLS